MTTWVDCQLAHITIEDEEGETAHMTVPAFTREELDFTQHINELHNTYVEQSRRYGQGLSTADFAMYLLTQAAFEPRQQ